MSTTSPSFDLAGNDPKYPIGKFTAPAAYTPELRASSIATIAAMPEELKAALSGLSDAQLDTPYREGGWTVRQLVHHIADSHGQAIARLKFALTEDFPVLAAYKEKLWAELPDALTAPVSASLAIIEGTHVRWVAMLRGLDEAQWRQGITHAVRGRMTIEELTPLYAWHSLHHVAHITTLRKQKGW